MAGGRTVLLCTKDVQPSLKQALVDMGIGQTIDFPYPPVSIFKAVLKAAQSK